MDNMSNLGNNIQSHIMNCFAFITLGTCYYGKFCRFNHPDPEEVEVDRHRGISQSSATPCKFFFAGVCKYGVSCRFSHSLPVVPNPRLHFNALGLPKRLGANTCSFYMRNGICGFGVACKYDHPEPVNQYPLQGYGSYAADELEEHQNEPDGNGYRWNGDENQYIQWREPNFYYTVVAESREHQNGYHGVTNGGNGNGNQYVQQQEPIYYPAAFSTEYQNEYHGVTNGGDADRYHQHPNAASNGNQQEVQARTAVVMKEPVTLSDVGLPLRPGKKVCLHYESLGLCKYGRRCKFDHPIPLSSNDEGSTMPVSGSKTPNAEE